MKWVSLVDWAASAGHSAFLPGKQVLSVLEAGACRPLAPGRPVCESGRKSEHVHSGAGGGPGSTRATGLLPPLLCSFLGLLWMLRALEAVGTRGLLHGSGGPGGEGSLEGLCKAAPGSGASRRTAMA